MFSRCTFVQEFPISPRMLLSPGRGRSPERRYVTFTAVELHSAGWHRSRTLIIRLRPRLHVFGHVYSAYGAGPTRHILLGTDRQLPYSQTVGIRSRRLDVSMIDAAVLVFYSTLRQRTWRGLVRDDVGELRARFRLGVTVEPRLVANCYCGRPTVAAIFWYRGSDANGWK